jgi:hypothetical protein
MLVIMHGGWQMAECSGKQETHLIPLKPASHIQHLLPEHRGNHKHSFFFRDCCSSFFWYEETETETARSIQTEATSKITNVATADAYTKV